MISSARFRFSRSSHASDETEPPKQVLEFRAVGEKTGVRKV